MRTNLPPRPCLDLSYASSPTQAIHDDPETALLAAWLDRHALLGTNPFPIEQPDTAEGYGISNRDKWESMKRYATCICDGKRFIINRLALVPRDKDVDRGAEPDTTRLYEKIKIHEIRVLAEYYCFIRISFVATTPGLDEEKPKGKMEVVNARSTVKDWVSVKNV